MEYTIEEEFDNLEQDEQDMLGLKEFRRLIYEQLYETKRYTAWDLRDSGEGL